ncbi:hypothetical protein Sme01_74140 [Sphaerisporangium melleum]|uniref:NodB homology domain-containing protein n=1 Tax=Sphaerisporangium melleum TaxID=321316 RepID=A0A917RR28_9ACTN|nr:hypothetical protein GCM10007964_73230 [Sphaerisporangium melleum]GII74938.1 hypothetical protein Sme01_74140 [Sphaerisporangium melleum]
MWLAFTFPLVLVLAGCGSVRAPMREGREDDATRVRTSAPVRAVSDPALLALRVIVQQPGWPGGRPVVAPGDRRLPCERLKCVALTFDDGPFDHTASVLDTLAAFQARATFFVVGQMVTPATAPLLRRMVSEGHQLGNHSWDHPALTSLSGDALHAQLERTQQVVRSVTGVTMRLMRPPYGATDGKVAGETGRSGLAQILWDLDTLDWRDRNSALVAQRAGAARPGAVVLLHDIHRTTAEALPRLLADLRARGYTFVTVSELYGGRELVPGRRYAGETAQDGRPSP